MKKTILTFMFIFSLVPVSVFSGVLDDLSGSWSGFYKAKDSDTGVASSLTIRKIEEESVFSYKGSWSIQDPDSPEFGISYFFVEGDEIYSCEKDVEPTRCTYWTLQPPDAIEGERYQEVPGKESEYLGYFYYEK